MSSSASSSSDSTLTIHPLEDSAANTDAGNSSCKVSDTASTLRLPSISVRTAIPRHSNSTMELVPSSWVGLEAQTWETCCSRAGPCIIGEHQLLSAINRISPGTIEELKLQWPKGQWARDEDIAPAGMTQSLNSEAVADLQDRMFCQLQAVAEMGVYMVEDVQTKHKQTGDVTLVMLLLLYWDRVAQEAQSWSALLDHSLKAAMMKDKPTTKDGDHRETGDR